MTRKLSRRRREALARLDATLLRLGSKPVDLTEEDLECLRQEKIKERKINIRNGYGD